MPGQLLSDDQVMEVVKVLAIHDTHHFPSMHMLPWSKPHSQHVRLGHLVNQLLRDERPILLLLLRLRRDVLVDKLPHSLLQCPVALVVVRTRELRSQPQRLGVRYRTQLAGFLLDDFGFLALEDANEEVGVLVEDFMSVEIVEGLGAVLTSYLGEDDVTAGVSIEEVGQVVNFVVDDYPEVVFCVMLFERFGSANVQAL